MEYYDILGIVYGLYASCFCGACFAWYLDHLATRRFRCSAWLSAVIYALWREVAPHLLGPNDGRSIFTIIRVLLLLALSIGIVFLMYRTPVRTGIYISVSWAAIFELSFFIAYVSLFFSDPVYAYVGGEDSQLAEIDPEAYVQKVILAAYIFETILAAFLTLLCIFSCRSIFRDFPRFSRDLTIAEFRSLILPALMGLLIGILLRMLIITIANGVPMYLFDQQPALKVVVPSIAVVALLGIVSAVRTLKNLDALEGEKRSRLVAEEQLKGLRERVKETERINAQVARMRHDLRNTLSVIAGLSNEAPEEKALSQYLSSLQEDMSTLERSYDTGDPVIDVLLTAKGNELEKIAPGTRLQTEELILPPSSDMTSYDLGIILGNALDNALHAIALQESGERYISLRSFKYGDLFFLRVQNSFSGDVGTLRLGGSPVRNAGEGLGLKNIQTIASKYEGTVDWKADDKQFTLSVMLKIG